MFRQSFRSLKRGFTLIELLIVVAIIAILAGIAVVNFLEAQTRAKVARAKSDLRTIATGLEFYRTDYPAYPAYHYAQNDTAENGWSFHVGGDMSNIFVSPPFLGNNPLTTPVAYLNQPPRDVFGKLANIDSPETADYWYVNWDYAITKVTGGFQGVFNDLRAEHGSWRIHSSGPDMKGPDTIVGEGQASYDATNGTISRGDVLFTQKRQMSL